MGTPVAEREPRAHPASSNHKRTAADESHTRLGIARMVRFGECEHPRGGPPPGTGSTHRFDYDLQWSLHANTRHPGRIGTLGNVAGFRPGIADTVLHYQQLRLEEFAGARSGNRSHAY